MKIKVIYPHNSGYVDTYELDSLIQSGRIMAFERQHKLVVVGLHPTRKTETNIYPSERRMSDGKS
jgi:hypothetical protein